jgi:Sel1 repeat
MNRLGQFASRSKSSKPRVSAFAVNSLAVVLILLVAVVAGYSQSKAEKKELAALTEKATDGDANAQLELGTRYLLGRGVPIEDAVQARNWFLKAADQGNSTAQFWLGEMFSTGWGIPEDKARAAIWYRKAAEQGLATAQFAIGNMYESGRGAPLNHKEAVKWIQKAANQGLAPAKSWMQMHGGNSETASASGADQNQQAPDQDAPAATPVAGQESAAQVDVRYFPGDSRAVTDAEMRGIRNSLRWDPESVVLKQGGTARSNLLDGKGQKMGSVLIRWDKTTGPGADKNSAHPDEWRGQFSIQVENATSCRFTSSAQLEDDQGFVVVTGATWNSWMAQHQPEAGQTSQAHSDAGWTQNFPSLVLKPLTAYSSLGACTTPKN